MAKTKIPELSFRDIAMALTGRNTNCECCANKKCEVDGCDAEVDYHKAEALQVEIIWKYLTPAAKEKIAKWVYTK